MLIDANKGPGLVEALMRDLRDVAVKIRNPVVCIEQNEPRLLTIDSNFDEVVVEVRNGVLISCDDEQIASRMMGQVVRICDGEIVESTDDALVQEIVDAYTINHARQWKSNQIALHSKALQDSFVSLYSVGEMTSWLLKRAESFAFSESGDPQDAPHLALEASVRGITLEALCEKVDANAELFAQLQATISGVEGKHRDAVAQLSTFEDVAAYDYLSDWPSVN